MNRDNSVLIAAFGTVVAVIVSVIFPETAATIVVVAGTAAVCLILLRLNTEEKDFITKLFFAALVLRIGFGLFVHFYGLRDFFGGDATQYDRIGARLVDYWFGLIPPTDLDIARATSTSGPGWGMFYLTGFIYLITGKNLLAAQSFCGVIGAATAPLVYFCTQKIFHNRRSAKIAAICIAVFPAFVIWSSQLLKDGLIIFLLVLAVVMVMNLQERFSYPAVVVLVLSLFGIISLRFYIFYMVGIAVAGSFIIGVSNSVPSIIRRSIVLVLMGLGLTYIGALRNAGEAFEKYGDLQKVQNSRLDLARSAQSGFGQDIDVSTPEGAISAIPVGFTYLMLAPFPWQMTNLRQLITLPEVLAWWAMIPLMISGIWYAVKYRLRSAFPILIFSLLLTLAYSIFQGNVGTAYRQRTQIQVFLFIFIGVGWTIYKERREDKKLARRMQDRHMERHL